MNDETYIVATIRPWNIRMYNERLCRLSGKWHLITTPQQLTITFLESLTPRYIFFPHWPHKVPLEIISKYECICFHETDVPYGRGGSPLQNLIALGHRETKISALRMVEELDAGPFYLKRSLSLEGLAEEIFIRASKTIAAMIEEIILMHPSPLPQQGDPIIFKRRTPQQSEVLEEIDSLDRLFDHIRMLDAEDYPRAVLKHGSFCYEFSRPALKTGCITADVKITCLTKRERDE